MAAYTMGIFQYFLLYACPSPGTHAAKTIANLGECAAREGSFAETFFIVSEVDLLSCEKE